MRHDASIILREGGESAFFREVLDASPVPTIILERQATAMLVIYVNRSFERRTGYSAAAILDHDWRVLCGCDSDCTTMPDVMPGSNDEIEIAFRGVRRDGSVFWSELILAPLGKEGAATHYVGLLRDVTAERAEHERLTHFALHDELTGLPNRRALEQRLALAIERAHVEQRAFPVLLLDLDRFKHVNDEFGHDAGDQLLHVIGARLRHELRAGDTVARVGGDEFVLLLESVREAGQLAEIRERLRGRVPAPVVALGTSTNVGCSIGASWFPLHGTDARSLSQHADRRMYEEKRRNHLRTDCVFAAGTRGALAMQHSMPE